MFTPTNPEQERIRALNALSALTEYDKAAALLAPNARHDDGCEQVEASRRPYASAYGLAQAVCRARPQSDPR